MDQLQNDSIFRLDVTEQTKSNLNGLSQWVKINAIIGFVGLGLSVISAVVVMSRSSRYGASANPVGTLVTVGISLLLNITLLSAAKFIQSGVATTSQGFFGQGIAKLASYFKIMGIIVIVLLVIFVLAFLLIGGARLGA